MSKDVSDRAIVRFGVADTQLTPAQRRVSFASMYFFGFITMYLMLRVAPTLTATAQTYGMDLATSGYIMTAFSIAGLIITIPGVWIMRNLGIKFALIMSAVITLIGTLIGIFSSGAAAGYLASRVMEGFGMGMVSVVGTNVIPRLFPREKLGLAMGIWSTWTALGILLATLIGPRIFVATGSVTTLSWLGVVFEVVAVVWLLACFRMSARNEHEIASGVVKTDEKIKVASHNYMLSGIVAAVSFVSYCTLFGMINNLYPTFLQTMAGMGIVESSLPVTILVIVCIPSGIIAGVLMDRFNTRKWTLVAAHLLLTIVVGLVAWQVTPGIPVLVGILVGLVAGFLPVAVRSLVPMMITDTRRMDYVLSIMALTTNVGVFTTGPYTQLIASVGWSNAALYALVPCGLVFTLLCLFCVKSDRKVAKEDAEALAECSMPVGQTNAETA